MSAKHTLRRKGRKLLAFSLLAVLPAIGISGAYFTDNAVVLGNKIRAGCWAAPKIASLLYPADGAATNTAQTLFSWEKAESFCQDPQIEYRFRIFSDSGLTTEVTDSGWQTETKYTQDGTPEGTYWWVVVTRDKYLNTSEPLTRSFIVDHSPPEIELTVSASPSKLIKEAINGEWFTTGNVKLDTIHSAQLGKKDYSDDKGNFIWENRLMRSLPGNRKTFSFSYRFHTTEDSVSDNPAFLLRVNGAEALRRTAADGDSDWEAFYLDLSPFANADNLSIEFSAGNTGDRLRQSWIELKKITTNLARVPPDAEYTFSGTDNLSGIDFYEYSIDSGEKLQTFIKHLMFNSLDIGRHTVKYRAVDRAGNVGLEKEAVILIDENYAPLEWDPFPQPRRKENDSVGYGDIVINELLWMGSDVSTADEYLELQNLTDRELSLDGLYFTKFDGTEEKAMDIDLTGKVIPASGLFLIGNALSGYSNGNSVLAVEPDIWEKGLELSNSNLQIRLYKIGKDEDILVDVAGDGAEPFSGYHDLGEDRYFSMQRVPAPGNGTTPLSWFTALDPSSTQQYFSTTKTVHGTPGEENR